MTRISTFAFALAALFAFTEASAATSVPIAEAGFALASNSSDTIAAPVSSDQGGGALHPTEAAVETPDRDSSHSEAAGGSSSTHDEHAQKAAPTDSTTATNSSTTTRKSRGNVHWQALLPGLMR
jgi:hypothetical protein